MARSQGKKIQITIDKEYSRLLGNLGWALLQLEDYKSAEDAYRKSLSFEPDDNKKCNLAICLIHLNKISEAKFLLHSVRASSKNQQTDGNHVRSYERATQILDDIELQSSKKSVAREDGVCVEVQTPLTLGLSSSEGFPNSTSSGNLKSQDVHHDQRDTQNAWLGNSFVPHHKDNNLNFSGPSEVQLGGTNWVQTRYENQFRQPYVSPGSLTGTPRSPFTQPRKCLWPSKGDRRTTWFAEDAVGRCNRKLTFKQHKSCEEEFKSTGMKASDCENWRKPMPPLEHHATASSELSVKQDTHLDCKSNVANVDQLENVVNCVMSSLKQVSIADHEQDSTRVPADSSFSEAAEKHNQSGILLLQTNRTPNESSTRKKSWAEMVEEDDEQLLESTTDDFSDENNNINIAQETPMFLNKPQNLNQKVELSGTKNGYYTQPIRGNHNTMFSSGNGAGCSGSPLQKRALDFIAYTPSGHLKSMKTKRLQVFRDITP